MYLKNKKQLNNNDLIGFVDEKLKDKALKIYNMKNNIEEFFHFEPDIENEIKTSISIEDRYNNWKLLYLNELNFDENELKELYNNINNKKWLIEQLKLYSPVELANIYKLDKQAFFIKLNKFGLYKYSYKNYLEKEIVEFLSDINIDFDINSSSIIKPLELDIYIPLYKLAIEMDGLYYHSSNKVELENKDYHLNKTKYCKEKGIQLFHIFETEWIHPQKQKIWKSIIKNKLKLSQKIYARKCQICQVSSIKTKEFLENNHLQGKCNSSINIGLYYEDELVSIMTFGKSRYDKKIDWELLRFCNKINYSIVGAASRLFKNFLKKYVGSVVSYADMRRSTGGLYKNLGFELSHESGPNYFYWKEMQEYLESRIQYQKHKLKNKLKEFDPNLTETENMYNNGYRKIFDCGNQVWIYK